MKILVVGSGGREHALVWKLAQSNRAEKIYCAPGNPGIAEHAECLHLRAADINGLLDVASRNAIDLTVVGPEQPLAEGIVDAFRQQGLRIFGPTRAAAELEWSKRFAKEFMARHRIPTGGFHTFSGTETGELRRYLQSLSGPVVLKADGLAAGKGVIVCRTREEASSALPEMLGIGNAAHTIVAEEYMEGEEVSVFAVTDGKNHVLLVPAQDHKRALDGDQGKNTGGMGAYAPANLVTRSLLKRIEDEIIIPTIAGMASEGRTYTGCLYAGLMITKEGPKVVEFNSRFGDPETQVVLPLYQGDLLDLLEASCAGTLDRIPMQGYSGGAALCVVLASGGYPGSYATGARIRGLEHLGSKGNIVAFHAGTGIERGELVTAGGRVLGITAFDAHRTVHDLIGDVYRAVQAVSFDDMQYRTDIGRRSTMHLIPIHS